MIRYAVTLAEIERAVKSQAPTWKRRAAARTLKLEKLKRFEERSSIWSEIKTIYMRIQHNKCAYCERVLEGEPYGVIEHDLEHFRPKGSVRAWPESATRPRPAPSYPFTTGGDWDEGYYLLAYNLLNYATACKSCNTPLKSSYFPIAGPRGPQSRDVTALGAEEPFLIYPLGEIDDDPESLITFTGVLPLPREASGPGSHRARVTIDFFDLEGRGHLVLQRAERINMAWFALQGLEHPTDTDHRQDSAHVIEWLTAPSSPHCNCVRAFVALYREDRVAARTVYEPISELLTSRTIGPRR